MTLIARQASEAISPNCFAVCNYGFVKYQAVGYQAELCALEYLAVTYLEICQQCIAYSQNSTTVHGVDIGFVTHVTNYCSSLQSTSIASTTTKIATKAVTGASTITLSSTLTRSNTTSTAQYVLSGLVTCPSRIVNPTYTPVSSLPATYLWGCPPGFICAPPEINCNFNQGPADTYVCTPDECEVPDPVPTFNEDVVRWSQPNYTIQAIAVAGNLMNLNPISFGLNFDIFNVYGQPIIGATQTSTSNSISQTNTLVTTTVVSSPTSTRLPQPHNRAWIAGAVLGPIAILLVALVSGIAYLRRRKRRMVANEAAEEARAAKPQLDATEAEIKRKELSGVHVNEMSNENPREELLGKSFYELGPPMHPAELDTVQDEPLLHAYGHTQSDRKISPGQIKRKPLPNAHRTT